MANHRAHHGLIGGLVIVAVGVILLLDQEGIVSAGHVFAVFWPAFFMLLGLEDLIAGFSPQKKAWGGLLFVGGSLFLLRNLGYLHIRFALLGPIVLIALGVWMLIWANAFPWHDGVFGPRGPFGHHGPFGPNGPFGPRGPFGRRGPIGKVFGSQGPDPNAQVPPPTGEVPSGAPQPATPPPMPPNPNPTSAGFADTGANYQPRDWHDWRRQQKWEQRRQKWEQRRQRHAWKQQWTGQYWDSQANAPNAGYTSTDSQFSYSAVLSHVERNITAKNFKSGTVSAFFGGFDIDLSRADIEGDEAVILADAFFGGGEIRIPETWHVVIEGSALFGAFMDETRQRPPEGSAPAKRLIIRGTALFGGITIQN